MTTAICWFRRDLRLADNPALWRAVESGGAVVGVFCLDPILIGASGPRRLGHLGASLRELNAAMGGALVIRHGRPSTVIPALAADVDARTVHVAGEVGPYGRRRDAAVADALAAAGRELVVTGSCHAVDPGTLRTRSGTPFRVFTPFADAWHGHGWGRPSSVPDAIDWRRLASDPAPPGGEPAWPAGESAAHDRLDAFLAGPVTEYAQQRDRPDLEGTSRLSVDLKFGALHPRQVLDRVHHGAGGRAFVTELCWRDFYADVLFHRPEAVHTSLDPSVGALARDDDRDAFDAWCEGRTGYPLVDAGMRQLRAEGWMHNRVRMVVASFLVKDLHLPWQWGARHFLRELLDGDLASNQLGWQWCAGTGTDAAPFFRIFNPTAQAKRHDPDGTYVRRYVPELAHTPDRFVHEPWRDPSGLPLGYPPPIVDHAEARAEALRRFSERPR